MRILVMGLPGSGKTTFSEKLAKKFDAVHFNADEIRKSFNDWDFSPEARLRQAERMKNLSMVAENMGKNSVCDFVCPTKETRDIFDTDYTIWMNTIREGRFTDTNKMFEAPGIHDIDYQVMDWNEPSLLDIIFERAMFMNSMFTKFDDKKPTALMIGRFQPFHDGHKKLFETMLKKEGQVLIVIRDTHGDSKNPFNFREVELGINRALGNKYFGMYKIMRAPNITGVYYGRDVGYKVEQIKLDDETEAISATKIREKMGL